jgi:hypothetical protein
VVCGELELGGREQLVHTVLGNEVPLELEEEQRGLDRRAELARLLHERAALGVRRVEREAQHRVRARAACQVVDRGQLVHGVGQAVRAQLGDAALVPLRERVRALAGLGQHLHDPLGTPSADERLEVP